MKRHQQRNRHRDGIVAATQTIAAVLALLNSTLVVGCGLESQEDPDKWGFIDRQGNFAIKPKFEDAGSFANGLAPVRVGHTWGYIDKQGAFVIKPQFADAFSFADGLASVQVGGLLGKWGFIDKQGHFAINPKYAEATSFRHGFAEVQLDNWKTGHI